MKNRKDFPEGMQPLGKKEKFTFHCHSEIDCYMLCCKKVDMFLFPYDILRLKTYLNISSQEFMENYSRIVQGQSHPYFPAVMLRLTDDEEKACPFLTEEGCGVYQDRPSACRTYPLERGVDRTPEKGVNQEFYFMTDHDYCHGHQESKEFTIKKWTRDQRLDDYNLMNDLWAEVDTTFSTNPWMGEGSGGPKQQVAFTVCYDIDNFRAMVAKHSLLDRFVISRNQKRRIKESDSELMKFGFEWLKNFLGNPSSLVPK
ncbi:MAG: YkgJ family cysteine cluster protein [Desulfocapsa sp.]|nr:MAG: YkgJ family cysteine cluster protein [Desulfocapsa sp.]